MVDDGGDGHPYEVVEAPGWSDVSEWLASEAQGVLDGTRYDLSDHAIGWVARMAEVFDIVVNVYDVGEAIRWSGRRAQSPLSLSSLKVEPAQTLEVVSYEPLVHQSEPRAVSSCSTGWSDDPYPLPLTLPT